MYLAACFFHTTNFIGYLFNNFYFLSLRNRGGAAAWPPQQDTLPEFELRFELDRAAPCLAENNENSGNWTR